MSTDPAFLFYPADASEDTQFMNRLERGCYFDLLKAQKKFRRFSLDTIKKVLGRDFETCWAAIEVVMKQDENGYFIEWADGAIEKRKAFTESRRQNRSRANNQELYIYLMKDEESGNYKIGSSVSPDRRLLELQKQYPNIKLMYSFGKTAQTTESELHKKYSSKHIVNEFFEFNSSDISDMIEHMTTHMSLHMVNHMVNENENGIVLSNAGIVNTIINDIPKKSKYAPTLIQVQEYFYQQGKTDSNACDTFFNYYEGTGWYKGITPISNWRAFANTWIANPITQNSSNPPERVKKKMERKHFVDKDDYIEYCQKENITPKLFDYERP